VTTRTKKKPIEHYIERAKTKLLKYYPELQFEVRKRSEDEAYLYFFGPYDMAEDGYEMLKKTGYIMSDAAIEGSYLLYVTPRD
jgi:hypothetical protein